MGSAGACRGDWGALHLAARQSSRAGALAQHDAGEVYRADLPAAGKNGTGRAGGRCDRPPDDGGGKELLHSGEEDRDALIDRLTQAQKPNQPPEQTEQAPQEQPEQPDPQAALRGELNKCVAEVYVMEAEYTGWLERANQSAIDEFTELPEAKQTTSAKYDIGMKYLSEALKRKKSATRRCRTSRRASGIF